MASGKHLEEGHEQVVVELREEIVELDGALRETIHEDSDVFEILEELTTFRSRVLADDGSVFFRMLDIGTRKPMRRGQTRNCDCRA